MNARCERYLGSARRECLDHIIILGRRHLVHVLRAYSFGNFNRARPHQGIGQRIPAPAATKKYTKGATVRAVPVLAGLHHDYQVAA
jgi:putative transposase